MRFRGDLDFDWTVNNSKSIFGMKVPASVDVERGMVLFTCLSKVSAHDAIYFHYKVVKGIHGMGAFLKRICRQGILQKRQSGILDREQCG